MLGFVEQRDQQRSQHANKAPNPQTAADRRRIARLIRLPTAGGFGTRPASPTDNDDNIPQSAQDPARASPTPVRAPRGKSAFDSDYSESLTSASDAQPFQRNGPRAEDTGIATVGSPADNPQPHDDNDGRPSSQSSELAHVRDYAAQVLQGYEARRLQSKRSRWPVDDNDADSYPPTTSGRLSSPHERPQDAPPLPPDHVSNTPPPADEPSDNIDEHRAAYMRQAAQDYQRRHADPKPLPAEPATAGLSDFLADGRVPSTAAAMPARPSTPTPVQQPTPADARLLDYPLATLTAKPFASLQAESFDDDPSRAPAADADDDADDDAHEQPSAQLGARLAAALAGPADAQAALLARIPHAEWAAADAWFAEQFAALAAARTAKRAERRAIARACEAAVAQRHADVAAQRAALRDALAGMRESGARVLELGTPTAGAKRAGGAS